MMATGTLSRIFTTREGPSVWTMKRLRDENELGQNLQRILSNFSWRFPRIFTEISQAGVQPK